MSKSTRESQTSGRPAASSSEVSQPTLARRFIFPCLVLLVAVAAGSAVAFGASSSATRDSSPAADVPTAVEVSSVDSSVASALKVFSRSQVPSDIAPKDIISRDLRESGANPQLGRLAGHFGGQDVFLVPDNGGVCLASSELLVQGCFSTAAIVAGDVQETLACYPYMPADRQEEFGILPGASDLEAIYSDGAKRSVAISGDVFVLDAVPSSSAYPVEISWTDSTGQTRTEPTDINPRPPVPHPCPASATLSPDGNSPGENVAKARAMISAGTM
jgi:hypothetical protein